MRLGELTRLKKDAIDFESGYKARSQRSTPQSLCVISTTNLVTSNDGSRVEHQ
jgi:hypothetical protein